jgi:hypothetical protein
MFYWFFLLLSLFAIFFFLMNPREDVLLQRGLILSQIMLCVFYLLMILKRI